MMPSSPPPPPPPSPSPSPPQAPPTSENTASRAKTLRTPLIHPIAPTPFRDASDHPSPGRRPIVYYAPTLAPGHRSVNSAGAGGALARQISTTVLSSPPPAANASASSSSGRRRDIRGSSRSRPDATASIETG